MLKKEIQVIELRRTHFSNNPLFFHFYSYLKMCKLIKSHFLSLIIGLNVFGIIVIWEERERERELVIFVNLFTLISISK